MPSNIQGVALQIVNILGGDCTGENKAKHKSDEIAVPKGFIFEKIDIEFQPNTSAPRTLAEQFFLSLFFPVSIYK